MPACWCWGMSDSFGGWCGKKGDLQGVLGEVCVKKESCEEMLQVGCFIPSWDIYRPNNLNSLTNVAIGYATFCCNSWRAKGQNYLTSSLQVIYSVKANRAARTAKWCLILLSHNKKIQLTINSSTFRFFWVSPSPPSCWSGKKCAPP